MFLSAATTQLTVLIAMIIIVLRIRAYFGVSRIGQLPVIIDTGTDFRQSIGHYSKQHGFVKRNVFLPQKGGLARHFWPAEREHERFEHGYQWKIAVLVGSAADLPRLRLSHRYASAWRYTSNGAERADMYTFVRCMR